MKKRFFILQVHERIRENKITGKRKRCKKSWLRQLAGQSETLVIFVKRQTQNMNNKFVSNRRHKVN